MTELERVSLAEVIHTPFTAMETVPIQLYYSNEIGIGGGLEDLEVFPTS
jgi:hypothetical protein